MKSPRLSLACLLFLLCSHAFAQVPGLEAKNWYFGYGTDGFIFDGSNIPYKVSNKLTNIGFEGIVVVSDPLSGALLFYSDGQNVVDRNHNLMFNGTGLFGHYSGAQTVQCVPLPGQPGKFYLLTSRAYDAAGDNLFYSIVDFTDPGYPLGKVTNKNTLLSSAIYGQANKVISKPSTTDYWWVGHKLYTNQYDIIGITSSGFTAPVSYTATGTNGGDSYSMTYSPITKKLAASGLGSMGLALMDFNDATGVASNPQQIFSVAIGLGNFSPDGTKLYMIKDASGYKLHQYDLSNGVTTNMNTCCYAHDTKTGPDGKMYHIQTYYSSTPIAVINNPNLSAVGNACGYVANAPTIIGAFNGEVRRFPEFVVMPTVPILGAEFTAFAAARSGDAVALDWSISTSCPGCTFVVERGNGLGQQVALGRVAAGMSLGSSFSDAAPLATDAFYRIKLIDADGKMAYSTIQQVTGSADAQPQWQVYPNPCADVLHLSSGAAFRTAQVEVYDLLGKRLSVQTLTQGASALDVHMLTPGMYLLRIRVDGRVSCVRFEKG
jgi:Secretion system C-terminal sorting domain